MEWYYSDKGRKRGPTSEADLQEKIAQGAVRPDDLVWCQGMDNWQPVARTPPFSQAWEGPRADDGSGAAREVEAEVVSTPSGESPYSPPRTGPGGLSAAPPDAGKATTSMVLGICGIVLSCIPCIGLILGILAVVFSGQVITAAQTHPELAPFLGKAKAGKITGMIAIALSVLNAAATVIINLSHAGAAGQG